MAHSTQFKKGELPPVGKQFTSEYQPDKEVWTEEEAVRLFNDLLAWFNEKSTNILFDEFLFDNPTLGKRPGKIYPHIIAYLKEKYPSCLQLYERANKIQEIRLVKYALHDKLNPTMSKFVLSTKHSYVEKQETLLSVTTPTIVFKNFDNDTDE